MRISPFIVISMCLTHYGLVMIYHGDMNLEQHRLRRWLVAWKHQAITRTNIDLSSEVFCGIHLRAISQHVLRNNTITNNGDNIFKIITTPRRA